MAANSTSEMHGRHVLVTGAGSGIGLATAEVLQRHGARVAAVLQDASQVDLVRARLSQAAVLVQDLLDDAACAALPARAAAALCGLSVSSASTARQGSVVIAAMRASCAATEATMAAHEAMADGRVTAGERAKIRAALVTTRDESVMALADLDAVVIQ